MSRFKLYGISIILIGLVSFFVGCGEKVAGTVETGNSMNYAIEGTLVYSNGDPASKVSISIRPISALKDTSQIALKITANTVAITTDSSGFYSVDTGVLDTGTYLIEGDDGEGNLVLIDSIVVTEDTSTINVPIDTLKPAGALKGTIRLSEGGSFKKLLVLVFGGEKFIIPEDNGNFVLGKMAEGNYKIRVIPLLPDYEVLDVAQINIKSGDTTNISDINLVFTGIPTAKGLELSYDTLMQIVTLTWDEEDSNLVKGYNVYRKDTSSDFVKINTKLVRDTSYTDDSMIQNETYEYKIAVVSPQDKEGTKGEMVGIRVVSAFNLLKTINVQHLSKSLKKVIGTNLESPIYLLSRSPNAGIFVIDSAGLLINSIGIDTIRDPYDMTIDTLGNIYVTDIKAKKIFKFDSTGTLVKSWNTNSAGKLVVLMDSILMVGSSSEIEFFSLSGDTLNKFPYPDTNLKGMSVGSQGNLFLYGKLSISEFTIEGEKLSSIYSTDLSGLISYNDNGSMIEFNQDKLMFVHNKIIYVVSEKGEVLSNFEPKGIVTGIHMTNNSLLWLSDIKGIINIYQ